MSGEIAFLLSVALIATVVVALYSKSTSISLIMLFYSSLIIGIIFATYGSILIGIVHVITFAGAVSVMLLTVILMTGQSELLVGSRRVALLLSLVIIPTIGYATFDIVRGMPNSGAQPAIPGISTLFQFIWEFRPWDLLILVMVFASSMIIVVNLLSRKS